MLTAPCLLCVGCAGWTTAAFPSRKYNCSVVQEDVSVTCRSRWIWGRVLGHCQTWAEKWLCVPSPHSHTPSTHQGWHRAAARGSAHSHHSWACPSWLRGGCPRSPAPWQTILPQPALRPASILGWVLGTSMDWWESSTRAPNRGSMAAAVTLPAFLLLQDLVRRNAWESGGKESRGQLKLWRNFIAVREITRQEGPVLNTQQ